MRNEESRFLNLSPLGSLGALQSIRKKHLYISK